MAAGEFEYVIKARDELTPALSQINAGMSRFGGETERQFDRASRGAGRFTQFIREQRQENRLQNFLFREGAQTIGALSLGLSLFAQNSAGADAAQKRLSRSLNEGFLAFQGINFALAAFGPQVSLVGGAIAGLAVGMTRFADTTEEDLARVETAVAKFVASMRGANQTQLTSLRDQLKRDLDGLNESLKTAQAGTVVQVDAKTNAAGGVLAASTKIVTDKETIRNLTEQILELTAEIAVIEKSLPSSYDQINQSAKEKAEADKASLTALEKSRLELERAHELQLANVRAVFPLQSSQAALVARELEAMQFLTAEEYARRKALEDQIALKRQLKELEPVREKSFEGATFESVSNGFDQLGLTAQNTSNLIVDSMRDAARTITDLMFGATQSIGQFFESLARSITQLLIEELLKIAVTSFITDVLGFAFGGGTTAVSPALIPVEPSGGASRNVNIYVNGEKLNATPTERRRTMEQIEKSIYSEKYAW